MSAAIPKLQGNCTQVVGGWGLLVQSHSYAPDPNPQVACARMRMIQNNAAARGFGTHDTRDPLGHRNRIRRSSHPPPSL